MDAVPADFVLTDDELRTVTAYVVTAAGPLLAAYEDAVPDDPRPRHALDAAGRFVAGERRGALQRRRSTDAHRAAAQAPTEVARLAARSAGDAASAAYLHPIARAHQVGHLLRAAASAARVAEIGAGDDPAAGRRVLEAMTAAASPVLVDVLRRYPTPAPGRDRVGQLLAELDDALRRRSP